MLFEAPPLDETELEVLASIDNTRHRLRSRLHQPPRWTEPLRRLIAAENIRASNAIEGHRVSRQDALSIFSGAEPLEAAPVDRDALSGYRDAMDYILKLVEDRYFAYSGGVVRGIHYMMMKQDPACQPGHYRPGPVYVHDGHSIVYEAPASEQVPALVEELMSVLNNAEDSTPAIVRAAMAHLNFVMIHPFKDGNGRMSRALQTLVLGREGTLDPHFSSIETYLGHNTPDYYRVLGEVGGADWSPQRDTRPWLRFILRAHHHRALSFERQTDETDQLWARINRQLAEAGLDERNMGSLYNAAMGFQIRRSEHVEYADVSERVATSDLARLVEAGFLDAFGDRRGRYYTASDRLKQLRLDIRSELPPIPDPFATTS